MGFSHLLRTEVALANFRARFVIPPDVDIAYCHEDNIALERRLQVVFFFSLKVHFRGWGEVLGRSLNT